MAHRFFDLAASLVGLSGTVADVAGKEEILGRPDGIVDKHDLVALYNALPAGEKTNVIAPGDAVKITASYWNPENHRDYSGTVIVPESRDAYKVLNLSRDNRIKGLVIPEEAESLVKEYLSTRN